MRTLPLLLMMMSVSLTAGQLPTTPWIAYGPDGKIAASTSPNSGELATVLFPTTAAKNTGPVAFVTTTSNGPVGNLTGKTLTASISLDGTGNPLFHTYTISGLTKPVAVKLWISSQSTPYNFGRVTDGNQANFWWSAVTIDLLQMLWLGPTVISESLVTQSRWSSALGKNGGDPLYTPAFNATAANVRQIGFSFGSYFFDTGAKVVAGTGSATFHVHSITAN